MKKLLFCSLLILLGACRAFAAEPTVKINNSTGSNTQASGAGPSTAVFGTGASTTATSAVVDVSADTPNLSGIGTTGTDVLYVQSSSGVKFSQITAVDDSADTITTEDVWANTEGTKIWAVGGKRLDFETTNTHTKTIFTDAEGGWIIDIEEAGLQYALTSTVTIAGGSTTDFLTIKSSSATRPEIASSTNGVALFTQTSTAAAYNYIIEHLRFEHTAATPGNCYTSSGNNATSVVLRDLDFEGCNIAINVADVDTGMTVEDSQIINSVSHGIAAAGAGNFILTGNFISGNGTGGTGHGVSFNGSAGRIVLIGNIIVDNASDAFNHASTNRGPNYIIDRNTFANNGGDGIQDDNGATGTPRMTVLTNNIFYSLVYGIRWTEALIDSKTAGYTNTNNFYGAMSNGYQT